MVSKKSDLEKQLIIEHEKLNSHIGALRLSIMKKVSTKDFPDWRIQFIDRLQELKQKLTKHFEFEERGGFMKEVTKEAPHFVNQVNELETDHKRILSRFDAILRDFKKLDIKDDLKLQDIFNRLSEVMTTLHQHEMTENEMMQAAFYRDHGSPD